MPASTAPHPSEATMLRRPPLLLLITSLLTLSACNSDPTSVAVPDDGARASSVSTSVLGGAITFASTRDGPDLEIYVLDLSNNVVTQLTNNADEDSYASTSPDGTRIAFASRRDLGGDLDIWVMNVDGTGAVQLTNEIGHGFAPAWSPDGNSIAFVSEQTLTRQIFVMNADGTNLVNLSNDGSKSDESPSWSPDGLKISFARGGDVFVMDASGLNKVNLTNTSNANDNPADWSPDGAKILFTSDRDNDVYELYTLRVSDGLVTRLTNSPGLDHGYEGTWSPDGTKILFISTRDGDYEVFMMDADGLSSPVNVTNNSVIIDTQGSWGVPPAFVPPPPSANPTNVEQCKNSGWVAYGFRNQGQCMRYVETGQDSRTS
jgi:Tol biopolymer transport system component